MAAGGYINVIEEGEIEFDCDKNWSETFWHFM